VKTANSVSLVLGSGGARGLAHIGVIKWLEENSFSIESISGSSIGALVGGVYGAGKLSDFELWVLSVSKFDILTFMDFTLAKEGFLKGEKIIDALKELVGDRQIETLPITYTAVASDIDQEREVWITKGSLFDAIRASISLPFLLTPFNYRGTNLIDGGVLNPVPIAPTFQDHTDVTIAVNLNGAPVAEKRLEVKQIEDNSTFFPFKEKIKQFFDNLPGTDMKKNFGDWSMYYIASQSFEAMQGSIARQKLAAYPPDLVIDIPRNLCGTLDFDRSRELISFGYQKMEENKTILKTLLEEN